MPKLLLTHRFITLFLALIMPCACDSGESDNSSTGVMASGPTVTSFSSTLSTTEPINQCQKEQNILILDFRSGWWTGEDGGDFYKTMVDLFNTSCGDKATKAEYHHVTINATYPFYERESLSAYSQLWVLSGSNGDKEDMLNSNDQFLKLIAEMATTQINLFLSVGDWKYYDSINPISQKLAGYDIITAATLISDTAVNILKSQGPLTGIKTLDSGIFKIGSLGITARDDITILATCGGPKQIPCIGYTKFGGRTVILDTATDRFYAIRKNDEVMKQYLFNLIRTLSYAY